MNWINGISLSVSLFLCGSICVPLSQCSRWWACRDSSMPEPVKCTIWRISWPRRKSSYHITAAAAAGSLPRCEIWGGIFPHICHFLRCTLMWFLFWNIVGQWIWTYEGFPDCSSSSEAENRQLQYQEVAHEAPIGCHSRGKDCGLIGLYYYYYSTEESPWPRVFLFVSFFFRFRLRRIWRATLLERFLWVAGGGGGLLTCWLISWEDRVFGSFLHF